MYEVNGYFWRLTGEISFESIDLKFCCTDFWLDAMDHGLIRKDEIRVLSGMSFKKVEHLAIKVNLKMCLMPTKQGENIKLIDCRIIHYKQILHYT